MNLKINKLENDQWLFAVSKIRVISGSIETIELTPFMYFTIKTSNNMPQFKQRLLTGLDAILNINDIGDKSYIRVFDGWCEFFIYTTSASMSCRIPIEDAIDELLKFIAEYS